MQGQVWKYSCWGIFGDGSLPRKAMLFMLIMILHEGAGRRQSFSLASAPAPRG
jgi:hypothetical protein